jgi:hypothetical protein
MKIMNSNDAYTLIEFLELVKMVGYPPTWKHTKTFFISSKTQQGSSTSGVAGSSQRQKFFSTLL